MFRISIQSIKAETYSNNSQLEILQKIAKRKNDLRLYADELGKGLIEELDYNLEAANALKFMVISSWIHICVFSCKDFCLQSQHYVERSWNRNKGLEVILNLNEQENNLLPWGFR